MRSVITFLSVVLCAGCVAFETPRNSVDFEINGYQAERRSASRNQEHNRFHRAGAMNDGRCRTSDLLLAAGDGGFFPERFDDAATPLSPGDMVRVDISRGEGFAGDYMIAANGALRIPHLPDIPAAGFRTIDLEAVISMYLVEGRYFQPGFLQVGVSLLQHAAVQVHVSGAVFQAGDVILNERSLEEAGYELVTIPGDHAPARTLSAALFASAGVRPDADIRNVVLMRGGERRIYDMSGALTGASYDDPVLVASDRIHVPSLGCFQIELARPSRITPPGVRVFMSNLTQPASSNAQSAIGQDATSLPYGTRLLQGVVSANCVGGTQATNAARFAVLISRNPITGESEVIARSIEDLVRRADRDDFNPVLLPNDAIACYDSHVTNLRAVLDIFSRAASPVTNAVLLTATR